MTDEDEVEEERNIICAAKNGEQIAYDKIVTKYLPMVYRYLARLTGDPHLAEELSQETFVRTWKNIGKFEDGKSFRPWVMRIARNCAFDSMRKKKTVAFSFLSEQEQYRLENIHADNPSPTELIERKEKKEFVERTLSQLSNEEKEVLILHYLEELTVPEVADMLKKPEETIRTRLRRARTSFREENEPDFDLNNV